MTRALGVAIVFLVILVIGWMPVQAQTAEHQHESEPQEATPDAADHSQHQPAPQKRPSFIPPLTDEDRKAAFPQGVEVHAVHDRAVNYFVLFDQFEWQSSAGGTGVNIDAKGWIGQDRDRFWFRVQGDGEDGRVGETGTDALYGRQFARWWDVVAGVRQDFEPGSPLTWAAFGIQGLAPYWFDIELTGYLSASGRTRFRGEVEYELLLTNRLVLQPLVEVELFGKSDPDRAVSAGLSTIDAGLRMRYEFKREFAPYAGVAWRNRFGPTADLSNADNLETDGARLILGMRFWF